MMSSLLAAADTPPSVSFALEWLAWIVLISAVVAVFIALTIKFIYLVLQIFSQIGRQEK